MDLSGIVSILPLVLIVGAFYFLVIRPGRNRRLAQQELLQSVGPGRRILLTSGIYATVVAVREGELDVEIADGVVITVMKAAVLRPMDDEQADGGDSEPVIPAAPDNTAPTTPAPVIGTPGSGTTDDPAIVDLGKKDGTGPHPGSGDADSGTARS